MRLKEFFKLVGCIILAQSAGLIGTFFTVDAIPTWYQTLERPFFAPPNFVFGPVWTVLYTLIGISLYLILRAKVQKSYLRLFLIHLGLNALWSPVFFGLKNLGLALIIIIIMDITLLAVIKYTYPKSKIAALLLIPYLAWILFATTLNFSFWQLNKQATPQNVGAQVFDYQRAYKDYLFAKEEYSIAAQNYGLKFTNYNQNQTLANKEELRLASMILLQKQYIYIGSYLTAIRTNISESVVEASDKVRIYSYIDSEITRLEGLQSQDISQETYENLLQKTKDEDLHMTKTMLPKIRYALVFVNLGQLQSIFNEQEKIYKSLKDESNNLVELNRADSDLFIRWTNDIEKEITVLREISTNIKSVALGIIETESKSAFGREFEASLELLADYKSRLTNLNDLITQMDLVINQKR